MNTQELIYKLKNDLTAMSEIKGEKYEYDRGYEQAIKEHLAMISNLDLSEKPVVPQFVADFYESIKDDFEVGMYDLCVNLYTCNLEGKIKYWFDCDDNKPIETLAKMKFYGYEVNKDKLYTVELPNNGGYYHIILARNAIGEIKLISTENVVWKESEYAQLTEAEIKKDFDWTWQFAEEVK